MPIINFSFFENQDFFFKPFKQPKLALFAYLMKHDAADIIVQNKILLSIQVFCRTKLEIISKMLFDNCFATEIEVNSTMTLL